MSMLLGAMAWGLLAVAVRNGAKRWAQDGPGPDVAHVATPEHAGQR
jgi:hypothetical protein